MIIIFDNVKVFIVEEVYDLVYGVWLFKCYIVCYVEMLFVREIVLGKIMLYLFVEIDLVDKEFIFKVIE